jgi:mannan endo-1,4-beta-mannosidase
MRSRLVMLMSLAIAALSVLLASTRIHYSMSPAPPVHASLPPSQTSYLGVYVSGSPTGYRPIAEFGAAAGRDPNLVGYFNGWAQTFDTKFADMLHRHGMTPFVQIDPTDASVAAIAAGNYDEYLRAYADAVKDFRHPVVIGFGHEMNAPWYSWGYGHVPAGTFVAAWRHIVTVFRQEGADNVTWLWTIEADDSRTGPIASWWPGARYVTWVGIDGFYYSPSDSFAKLFAPTIDQVRSLTAAPVLLSETAVGPDVGSTSAQFAEIQNLFQGLASYKTLGLVWFDIAQHGGIYRQDWRIQDSRVAEVSFQLGVTDDLKPAAGPGA